MGAGGGTFVTRNKILPGAYINFVSQPRAMATLGVRGIVAGLLNLNWGKEGEIVTVEAGDFQTNSLNIFGYSFTSQEMLYVRELFLGARTLKFYRPSGGNSATVTIGYLRVDALYGGIRGNDIKIVIESDIDDEDYYFVTTLIGEENVQVDTQRVKDIKELLPNSFVKFAGEGELEETAGINLEGGTSRKAIGNDYSTFLGLVEKEEITTLFYSGNDGITKGLFTAFTRRLRNDEGYKITTVLHNYATADFEGVISVKNEVEGEDKEALVYWVAGTSGGAEINQSLTNTRYNGTLDVNTKYSSRELEEAIQGGEFIFYGDSNNTRVVKDINSFTSFNPNKNRDFSSNQVIRVLDEIGNSTARIFNDLYLGSVQNNDIGRTLFKSELISYNEQLQAIQAITNFESADIDISQGQEKGDVVVSQYIEPVSAMEKLYMTVRVI